MDYQAVSELRQRAEAALEKHSGRAPATARIDPIMQEIGKVRKMISEYGHDPAFDEGGLKSLGFRAAFSLLDSDNERKWWLTKRIGKTGWTQDRYGRYAITPEGMVGLGYASGERPVLIDEPGPTMYDFVDFAGDLPPILGSAGLAMMATGAGTPVGIASAMAGAGIAKALQEIAESYAGMNIQPPMEVAGDVGMMALTAGGGEAGYRGARAIVRKFLAPERHRMTPQMRNLVQESKAIGVQPSIEQITKAPIVGRIYRMLTQVVGDPLVKRNERALTIELDRLRDGLGRSGRPDIVGVALQQDISSARQAVARWSAGMATKIEQTWAAAYTRGTNMPPGIQGLGSQLEPPVPTARLKQMAMEIYEALPRSAAKKVREKIPRGEFSATTMPFTIVEKTTPGRVILTPPELETALLNIKSMPENITIRETQQITEKLYDAIGTETIVPGIFRRDARLLWKAASGMYEDIVDPSLREMMLQFRGQYKEKIANFNHAYINRLMKRSDTGGYIEPEQVVDTFFKKGGVTKLNQIESVVRPETWVEARRIAMEEILSSYEKIGDDPLQMILDGTSLHKALDSYTAPTLRAMFGPQKTAELYRLAKVTQLAQFKLGMSGGIVAASIALHPVRNLPRIIQINIMARIMTSQAGIRWLTEGIEARPARIVGDPLGRLATYVAIMARDATRGPVENDLVTLPTSLPPTPMQLEPPDQTGLEGREQQTPLQ